jgi:adenylate cyclase
MSKSRQLAAIMFADIAGYTATMQEDEVIALQLRQKLKLKLDQQIIKHNGRLLEFKGDGVLCSFNSTIEGVRAALELQLEMQKHPVVPLRIGMHTGDVVFEGDDIYGDGVNIASRMESFAIPGGIFITGRVYDDIKNQKDIHTISLGKYVFKNVKEPVDIYAIANPGVKIPTKDKLSGKGEKVVKRRPRFEKSIAVLPFVNISNDPEQEYFSDGIAEEIIHSLAPLTDLKVAGRISSFQFKGKNAGIREIGNALNVKNLLEGSIRKQGNRLRITTQLVNVEDGYQIWSKKYDREMNDIFSIQDEIALAITEELKVTLFEKDRKKILKTHTVNPEAYEDYLKGLFHLNKRGPSIFVAIEFFKKAVEKDKDFALAYAFIADAMILAATFGMTPPKLLMSKAKEFAEKAIKLDATLSEPYHALGFYYTCFEWNWAEAKKNFQKALELNPKNAEVHYRYGWNYLTWVEGNFDEAGKHGEVALKLEPLHSICYATYSLILYVAGKYEKALTISNMGLELESNSFLCLINKGSVENALHKYEDAIATFKAAMAVSNRHHFAVNGLIWNYCLIGKYDEANELLNELKERSQKEYIGNTLMALSFAYFNKLDEAFEYLDKAYNDRDPMILTIKYLDWSHPSMRNDPRYQKMLDAIGFPK